MESCVNLILFLVAIYYSSISSADTHDGIFHYPLGDPRNCLQAEAVRSTQDDIPLNIMQVLPGIGWDNLRNVDAGYVNELNYSKCRTTGDRHYLLPDNVYAVPIQHSTMQQNAMLIHHWDDWHSYTASTINAKIGYSPYISGQFSISFQDMKTRFINEKAQIARVELRHNFYSLKLHPNSPLDHGFKARLLEMATHLENNRSRTADYLAELLIKEYGTDYTNSIDTGGLLVQEDYLDSVYMNGSSERSREITASAAASFYDATVGASFGNYFSTKTSNNYVKNRRYSKRESFGGIPFRVGLTLQQWEESLANSMVAIDRSGFPLDYAITVVSLPEVPSSTRRRLRKTIRSAITRYYQVNTYKGCTDPNSPNFDYIANLGIPAACLPPETNTTFGGVFQSCTQSGPQNLCAQIKQLNPLTGNLSCPTGYQPIQITRGSARSSMQDPVCQEVCTNIRHLFIFKKRVCTKRKCENVAVPTTASYDGYWCAAIGEVPSNTGYLFGGLFTSKKINPVTGVRTCPQNYIHLRLGADITVCASNDYELDGANSLPFGGFHSCVSGNPLAVDARAHSRKSSLPNKCPRGFSQHLADIDTGCQINYCVQAGQLKTKRLPEVILPPFKKKPVENQWSTNTVAVQTVNGEFWVVVNGTNKWKKPVKLYIKDDETVVNSDSVTSMSSFYKTFIVTMSIIALLLQQGFA